MSDLPDEQPDDDGLLHVPAVLGLVPDHAARALEHLGGDLLAAVGGQAVQRDRVGGRVREQGVVELPRGEHLGACLGLGLAAHRDPGVGGETSASGGGLDRVGDEVCGAAGRLGDLLGPGEDRVVGSRRRPAR